MRGRQGVVVMNGSISFVLGVVLLFPLLAFGHGSGANVTTTLVPDEQAYSLHQPVTAQLILTNDSDRLAQIDFGRNFQGNVQLVVNGVPVPPPGLTPGGGVSFPGEVELAPGKSYSRRLLLDDWHRFDEPGSYQVRVVLESPPLRLEAASTIVIGPRDPELLSKACSELSRQAREPEVETSVLAARALSYVGDEACLDALAEVLRESFHGKEGAIIGLLRIGSEPALHVLVDAWDLLRWDQQALVLNEAKQRGKDEALRKALLKAGKSPREPQW